MATLVVHPMTMISKDSSTFNGSFQLIGATDRLCAVFKVINNSTVDITISFDGVTAHDFVPAGASFVVDCVTNRGASETSLAVYKGQTFYVKGSSGTGSVYVSGYGPG